LKLGGVSANREDVRSLPEQATKRPQTIRLTDEEGVKQIFGASTDALGSARKSI
jgi:hypothetical protein